MGNLTEFVNVKKTQQTKTQTFILNKQFAPKITLRNIDHKKNSEKYLYPKKCKIDQTKDNNF